MLFYLQHLAELYTVNYFKEKVMSLLFVLLIAFAWGSEKECVHICKQLKESKWYYGIWK